MNKPKQRHLSRLKSLTTEASNFLSIKRSYYSEITKKHKVSTKEQISNSIPWTLEKEIIQ